jgi:hypothetical protein
MAMLLVLALLGLIPASIAQRKGGSFFGWWLFGVLLFIVAVPAALLMKPRVQPGVTRRCLYCTEVIPVQATVCRVCHRDVPPVDDATPVYEPHPWWVGHT